MEQYHPPEGPSCVDSVSVARVTANIGDTLHTNSYRHWIGVKWLRGNPHLPKTKRSKKKSEAKKVFEIPLTTKTDLHTLRCIIAGCYKREIEGERQRETDQAISGDIKLYCLVVSTNAEQ
ncbi:hypothetical protein J6590_097263 [Homalodisca vitripennis]|nr:hypothetical protein J6590_097263 [Homalodisca vitripennis]